jgi:hypothetical protein
MLDIELMWKLFPELKAIQVVELMSLGRWSLTLSRPAFNVGR